MIYIASISAKNPPPACFGVPYLEKAASICVDFHDLDLNNSTFSGCVKVEARLYAIMIEEYELGCFNFPVHSLTQKQMKMKNMWYNELHQAINALPQKNKIKNKLQNMENVALKTFSSVIGSHPQRPKLANLKKAVLKLAAP